MHRFSVSDGAFCNAVMGLCVVCRGFCKAMGLRHGL